MPRQSQATSTRRNIPHIPPAGGTGTLDAATPQKLSSFKRFLKVIGPGVITGASDDDPSGIGTYAIAGASFGFSTLWMALLTLPMMSSVQYTCAKIAMVSGRGLAGVLKVHYSKKLLYPAVMGLVVANSINAGADIGVIAAGMNLLVPVSVPVLAVPIALSILALQIWGSYSTTISPYMFFWQSSQEVEEEIAAGRKTLQQRKGATDAELRYAAFDVNIGMLLSNAVMYFIILSTAATLFKAGKTDIKTATDAAEALRPLAGRAAEALLAIGLIGAGFLAVPILTGSSAYAVAETFGWKHGFDKRFSGAKGFYGLIAASTLLGTLVNFVGLNPVQALFWTAVINGFLAPPLLILIIMISKNSRIMGNRMNGRVLNGAVWATAIVMPAAGIALVATWGH
jgi:Mn2+/Fe2+ NRAMP family transporter